MIRLLRWQRIGPLFPLWSNTGWLVDNIQMTLTPALHNDIYHNAALTLR